MHTHPDRVQLSHPENLPMQTGWNDGATTSCIYFFGRIPPNVGSLPARLAVARPYRAGLLRRPPSGQLARAFAHRIVIPALFKLTLWVALTIGALCLSISSAAQTVENRAVAISGFVRDATTNELLIGANISVDSATAGAATNQDGFFVLRLPFSPSQLTISYIGYQPLSVTLPPGRDTLLQLMLTPNNALQEVIVVARKPIKANVATLSVQELATVPALGGRPDVLKALQLLPGIQSQNEGSSLLVVRGGSPGENLYLIDNTPLIYVNHLGGFLSVFNPDMINEVKLWKGGFPARYGGRLSSIVDITQREGLITNWRGSASVAVTDLAATLEGPLPLKNASMVLTARKTVTEGLMYIATAIANGGDTRGGYGFHDVNAKLSWRPDANNSFHLNFYQGDDYLNFLTRDIGPDQQTRGRLGSTWGNWLLAARWKRTVGSRLLVTNGLSFTRYRLRNLQRFSSVSPTDSFFLDQRYASSVQDLSWRGHAHLAINQHWNLDFGVQASYFLHDPNQSSENLQTSNTGAVASTETALFVESPFRLGSMLEFSPGLRLVYYGTQDYHRLTPEPRISATLALNDRQRLHASYMYVTQNAQLLFTSGSIANNEVWVPAGSDLPTATAHQYAAGWTGEFAQGDLQAEVSFYYKASRDLANYREGFTNLLGDSDWRSKVEAGGSGHAKGMEVLLRKNTGPWTGFVSYTLSEATRQFPGINGGRTFRYEYDRPHSIALSVARRLRSRLLLSAAWVYQTGLPYTPVIGRQLTPATDLTPEGELYYYDALIYGERNSDRMKQYHRLDVALQYTKYSKKRGRKVEWTFSVYNVYNRRNPYFYYLNDSSFSYLTPVHLPGNNATLALYQASFFPIIPSVAYKMYFDPANDRKMPRKDFRSWLRQE